MIKELQNPSESTLEDFEIAYRKARKLIACPMPPSKNPKIDSIVNSVKCDESNNQDVCMILGPDKYPTNCKTDTDMMNAIANNHNVIMESTGKSIPSWFLNARDKFLTPNYKIIISWIFVNQPTLENRISRRAISQIKEFNMNPVGYPAVRLPKKPSELCNAIKLLGTLYSDYILKNKLDSLLLWNNNIKLELNCQITSNTDAASFEKCINGVKLTLEQCGGSSSRISNKRNITKKRKSKPNTHK